jgi:ribosomal-protein-alanine N-acetyltransferase
MMTAPVSRRLASWPVPYTVEMAERRIEEARGAAWNRRLLPLVLERRSDGVLLGWISVAPASPAEPRLGMLTHWLGEAFHGQGIMREAAPPAIAAASASWGWRRSAPPCSRTTWPRSR